MTKSKPVPVERPTTCLKIIIGWWLSHPSEKYESHLELLFPIYAKNVPNHQPD
jgi:hypothetical protein